MGFEQLNLFKIKMKKYKASFLVFAALFAVAFSSAQERTVWLEYEKVRCIYNLKNGRLTGNYNSFYLNGKKRAEGKLENGYRTGKWIVWDSAGRKRMERIYKNPFEYSRVFPAIPDKGPIPLLAENKYKLAYDSNGIVNYALMRAEDAIWRHKFWRYLEPADNDILFKNNKILKIIFELIRSGNTTVFDIVNDRFTMPLKNDIALNLIDPDKVELVGLSLKEESIFDMGRLVSEYRILGFCPVVKIGDKVKELFWVYYPDVRKYLGKQRVIDQDNIKIKTFDDLFIFRHFSSSIIKTTYNNPYDRYYSDYPGLKTSDLKKMAEMGELQIIEEENNIWLGLTK